MKAVLLFVAAILAFGAGQPARAATDEATALALMHTSLWDRLGADTGGAIREELTRNPRGLPPSQVERMARRAREAYAPERLRAVALAVIVRDGESAQLESILAWCATPLGTRITRIDKDSVGDIRPFEVQIAEGVSALGKVSEERRELLVRLVKVSNAVEAVASISINTVVAVQVGAACAVDCERAPSPQAIQKLRDELLPGLRQALPPVLLALSASLYAPLSDGELTEYVDITASPAGRHVADLELKAYEAAVIDAAAHFGSMLPGTRDTANP